MGGSNADTTPEDGAESIIKACFLDEENPPTGKHWRYGVQIPIETIPVIQGSKESSQLDIIALRLEHIDKRSLFKHEIKLIFKFCLYLLPISLQTQLLRQWQRFKA
jgi:hypothetical protein